MSGKAKPAMLNPLKMRFCKTNCSATTSTPTTEPRRRRLCLQVALVAVSLISLANIGTFLIPSASNDTSTGKGQCRFVHNVRNINYHPSAGNKVYLLLSQPEGCNVYHQLWSYLGLFRDAMIYGVLDYARKRYNHQRRSRIGGHNHTDDDKLHVYIGLWDCLHWMDMLAQAFPTDNLPVAIHTEKIKNNDFDTYMTKHGTTEQNCFTFRYQWNTFLGLHLYWQAIPADNPVRTQMHQWADNVVKSIQSKEDQISNSSQRSPQLQVNHDDVCHRERPLVLFVERSCTTNPRTVIDLETGLPAFPKLATQAQKLGYDAEILTLCNDPTTPVPQFARANVIVSSHGAQLSNLIFMRPCNSGGFPPAVVEISFRFAWCKFKDRNATDGSRAAMLDRWYHHCSPKHRYYNKADFFRLATGMGIRYTEVIQEYLQGYEPDTPIPIMVKGMVANSTLILQELQQLLQDPTYDYKQHPTYNGLEGVQPYRIGTLSWWDGIKYYVLERLFLAIAPYKHHFVKDG